MVQATGENFTQYIRISVQALLLLSAQLVSVSCLAYEEGHHQGATGAALGQSHMLLAHMERVNRPYILVFRNIHIKKYLDTLGLHVEI